MLKQIWVFTKLQTGTSGSQIARKQHKCRFAQRRAEDVRDVRDWREGSDVKGSQLDRNKAPVKRDTKSAGLERIEDSIR